MFTSPRLTMGLFVVLITPPLAAHRLKALRKAPRRAAPPQVTPPQVPRLKTTATAR
jgi:hypothetical protein